MALQVVLIDMERDMWLHIPMPFRVVALSTSASRTILSVAREWQRRITGISIGTLDHVTPLRWWSWFSCIEREGLCWIKIVTMVYLDMRLALWRGIKN
jgi:hypothetical protein